MSIADEMHNNILEFGSGPSFDDMPRLSLEDKLQNGASAAHRIEEIHTPFNYAYITCTTGSSAFQNIVGVTWEELPERIKAGKIALEFAGVKSGMKVLISYPPLVSVFSKQALVEYGIQVEFITRPSRDALIADVIYYKPQVIIGESSFLGSALIDAERLGMLKEFPDDLIFIAAGSPLDERLNTEAEKINGAEVHDLYGCQEFGWLCIDGRPLRDDIIMWDIERIDGRQALIVGGLPTGDCFLVNKKDDGMIIDTPSRRRMDIDPDVMISALSVADVGTAVRIAKTILRCKAKIVRVNKDCRLKCDTTEIKLQIPETNISIIISGPDKTKLFDDLAEAQKMYQRNSKADPVWNKKC